MQSQQTLQKREKSNPIFAEPDKVFDQIREFSENVATRAYEFFDGRGRQFGHELEDWLRAEEQLMRRVPVEVRENATQITVRAEVPGFTVHDIQVSVEPSSLLISGKAEEQREEKDERTVFAECSSRQFYRWLDLPAEVDPAKATATLKDGILELDLTKAPASQAARAWVTTA